ncbi:MAG: hypothetical protein RI897_587 [Verrucomicrobiota bacterium]
MVKRISDDRASGLEQVHPDLMCATCNGASFDQGLSLDGLDDPEVCFGFLTLFAVYLHAANGVRVAGQRIAASPGLRFGDAVDHCEVGLPDAAGFEEVAEGSDCADALDPEKDAGGFGIETMHVPEHFKVPGFGPEVTRFDGGGDGCGEVASRGLPSEGDEHPACRFVDGDD